MKKIPMLIMMLAAAPLLLSGCAYSPFHQMEAMFTSSTPSDTVIQEQGSNQAGNGNTVTISREEYEKYQRFSELVDLYDAAESYFYIEPDYEKMLEYAAKGLMTGLEDPYSFYYNPKEFTEMQEDDEGNYVGIGVLISSNFKTQICTISRVFDGSPAKEAGVLRGDILYKVGEDLYVTPDNVQDAVDIMRGVEGTDVDVTFLRNGEEITMTITRKAISVNQVESTMLEGQIGYIAFYQFAGHCEKEFEQALNNLMDQGAKGLIIDLRDNPGGWVEQARYVADLFLDEGELCYLVYRNGEEVHTDYLTKDGKVDIPLVILINENSASSSEILTGALKDRADATIVGVTSFGKGIIQGVWNIGTKGAGFQMTIAQYYTPNGNAVHEKGITPDIEVPLEENDNGMYDFADATNDPQLKKAVEIMKEKTAQ